VGGGGGSVAVGGWGRLGVLGSGREMEDADAFVPIPTLK
jgi:hypothetical protein